VKIHEYQAKSLFEQYQIPTPPGRVAVTAEEARKIAQEIKKPVVVKAQVHVGGRGKAGGVKLVNTPDEAYDAAKQILGMDLKGYIVKKVLVVEAVSIQKEIYLGMILDRDRSAITCMVSEAGGMDIEEVAATTPEKIIKCQLNPLVGFRPYHATELLSGIFKDADAFKTASYIAKQLYSIFIEKDCDLVEINPLAILDDGSVKACDAKITFDDNALYRQKDVVEMKDMDYINPLEEDAKENGLSFVQLEGTIGCIVNGAGLAMATMDVVKLFKGKPANFLDVGGSSNPKKVVKAFEILKTNPDLKAVLINIFGGITRCDDIANGIIQALKEISVDVPIVVRLTGTNQEEAMKILAQNQKLITARSMNDAVEKAVAASN
jgi:succinyl-CoA synthetase beta subunit